MKTNHLSGLLILAFAVLLQPCPARASDQKWEYKLVAIKSLVMGASSEPAPQGAPKPPAPEVPKAPVPEEAPKPDANQTTKTDPFATVAKMQNALEDAVIPRVEAALNQLGQQGWELCGVSQDSMFFKRPIKQQ
jgi:hypothetical protein